MRTGLKHDWQSTGYYKGGARLDKCSRCGAECWHDNNPFWWHSPVRYRYVDSADDPIQVILPGEECKGAPEDDVQDLGSRDGTDHA